MKRLPVLALILLTSGAALYMAQRRKTADAVNANAVVDVAADLQRDITRVPMRITRLSDRDEVRIGDQLVERYGYADPYADAKMASIGTTSARSAYEWPRMRNAESTFTFTCFPIPV